MAEDATSPTGDSIYDELAVPRVINGAGTRTRVGGTRIRPEAADAMREAARGFARIADLQARASTSIADATGAQAGYVISGAAAGLTMAAAACIAGDDPAVMASLPDTTGHQNEIVMPLVHRNAYDRAFRMAGASVVSVGTNDRQLGAGGSALEPWEVAAAITDETAAVCLVPRDDLPVEPVIRVADEQDVPVIVDAAGLLPPRRNLTQFVEAGADLVVFSGGKGIRGPQSTGIVAGRQDLIASIALQHLDMDAAAETWSPPPSLVGDAADRIDGVPRHGLGRGFKVGKEELVGLLRALERFVSGDDADDAAAWDERARRTGERLSDAGITVSYPGRTESEPVARVSVEIDPASTGITARELVAALNAEDPRIEVGDRDLTAGRITIDARSLTDAEADYVVDRILATCTLGDPS